MVTIAPMKDLFMMPNSFKEIAINIKIFLPNPVHSISIISLPEMFDFDVFPQLQA